MEEDLRPLRHQPDLRDQLQTIIRASRVENAQAVEVLTSGAVSMEKFSSLVAGELTLSGEGTLALVRALLPKFKRRGRRRVLAARPIQPTFAEPRSPMTCSTALCMGKAEKDWWW